jgi:hypothetical protein
MDNGNKYYAVRIRILEAGTEPEMLITGLIPRIMDA